MWGYILRRLLLIIPTLVIILLVNFVIIQAAPGGPVEQAIAHLQGIGGTNVGGGSGETMSGTSRASRGLDPQLIKDIEKQYGFDKPAHERLWLMLKNYAQLDFGKSFFRGATVTDLILEKMPVTVSLGLWATLITYLVSIPLGIRKAVHHGSHFDIWSSTAIIIGYAMPAFLFAMFLIVVFAGGTSLNWFPVRGLVSDNFESLSTLGKIADYFWHLVLPVTALVIGGFATLTILTKNSFLNEITRQYVVTARAKGLSERRVPQRDVAGGVGHSSSLYQCVLRRFPADRSDLLPRRPRPHELRSGGFPGLSGRVRLAVHLHPVWFADKTDWRPVLHPRRSAHRLRREERLMFKLSPLGRRRFERFKKNRRGWWSLWLFIGLFVVTLGGELIANDKPLMVSYQDQWYFPVFKRHTEQEFGGQLPFQADYRSDYVQNLIRKDGGWLLFPPIPFSDDTPNYDLNKPAPSPPTAVNWLGTDDQSRDVLARVIFGARVSILFALMLTFVSAVIGIAAGALQGYYGGWVDLLGQRLLEVWSGLPVLYLLIILSGFVEPNFWWLLGIMALFSWLALVDVVRAEFLRGRNLEYVKAARALGLTDRKVIVRHILPNAMNATLSYLPFILTGAISTLTALDFLGFGMPAGSASLGELIGQGKQNLQAPWLGLTAFFTLALILSLLVFIGEALRDAFDPRS